MQLLRQIIFASGFLPHGYCYRWTLGLVGLPVVSDSLISRSHQSIPVSLLHFVRKRRDVSVSRVILCFEASLVARNLYWLPVNQAPPRHVFTPLEEESA